MAFAPTRDAITSLLVPIGGAEDKGHDALILRRFVASCGGSRARIAVLPTASQLRDTGRRYEELFAALGAASARALRFRTRADTENRVLLDALAESDGVFLTGGSQTRLMKVLGGSPVAEALHALLARGAPIAGTSAGAAVMSERMIAYGESGEVPRRGMVAIRTGLGLTRELIVDQHFRQRGRIGRLLTAVALHPDRLGIGLDEDTAAFITPDGTLEIVGSGAATLVDPAELSLGHVPAPGERLELTGVRLHILGHGATYDLRSREARASRAP